jgi:predicted ATPase
MATLTIKNVGPIKELRHLELTKVNVFMGPQSSGKSTIAKIISYCTWVEKDVATSQSLTDYQGNSYFKERIEDFHKMRGYFKKNSYIFYQGDTVKITWKDETCSIWWEDQYAYKRSKIAYIPSERNMVILPEARKVEFGDTNVRSFLFDWFDARQSYPQDHRLPILGLGIDYYNVPGNKEEDHIMGLENGDAYDIPLSNASSGLQSVIPLVVMVEYLTTGVYKEKNTSFEQKKKQGEIFASLYLEVVVKPYFKIPENVELPIDKAWELSNEIVDKINAGDKKAKGLLEYFKNIMNFLTTTQNSQLIIEEPEQNLFPSTQRDLIYYLLARCFTREGNRLTLTTHSPYILYALNNCMLANLVKDKMSKGERSEVKSLASAINPQEVSIWEIKVDGTVKNIQGEDNLIEDNYFDACMKEVMDDYYAMINYYGDED